MEYIGQIILMAVLLFASAMFSGSETAYFKISPRNRRIFKESGNKLQKTAANLIENPHKLLTSFLLGNMAVNVLYFALASALTIRLRQSHGNFHAITSAVIAFFALLMFGEMLPKSLAFYQSKTVCIVTAPFCLIITRILSPLIRIFERLIITPLTRLLTGDTKPSKLTGDITVNQFKLLIESSRQQGLISDDENQLFGEVMELRLLKVRHVMRPRVDMICQEAQTPTDKIRAVMHQNKITQIPIYSDEIDNIIGLISLHDLILTPDKPLSNMLTEANFVPEQKSIESLLEFFRKTHTDIALVVDEYGGVAGQVCLEDCVEEILGPIDQPDHVEPIEQIGPLQYRLSGNLAIHEWAEVFGINVTQSRLTTIAGLTTALLGKVPKPGDTANIKNLKLVVESVQKNRIQTIILTFEELSQ